MIAMCYGMYAARAWRCARCVLVARIAARDAMCGMVVCWAMCVVWRGMCVSGVCCGVNGACCKWPYARCDLRRGVMPRDV